MHGHSDGRYAASALLLDTTDVQTFVGMHRHDRDISNADLAALAALQRPIAAAMSFRAAVDDTVRLLQSSSCTVPGVPEVVPGRRRTLDAAARFCSEYEPTRPEGEVLALAAQGWTNHQIGRRLGITERTVRKHLTAVLRQSRRPRTCRRRGLVATPQRLTYPYGWALPSGGRAQVRVLVRPSPASAGQPETVDVAPWPEPADGGGTEAPECAD
jgi:hypothetical protein